MNFRFRTAFALLLMFAILLQTFGKVIIYANYAINKDYITNVFCINKEKPKMQCNGKCHLKKQLTKQEEREQSPLNPIKEMKEFQLFHKKAMGLMISTNTIKYLSENQFQYIESTTEKHLSKIFHPPLV